MAKKTTLSTTKPCKDWNDVDQSLKRMGEIQVRIEDIEGEQTLRINEIKEDYTRQIEELKTEQKALETGIESFAESNKDAFADGRTRELTFGKIAYRVVKSIRVASIESCVKALRDFGYGHMVRVVETPDKEAMAELKDDILVKVSAKRVVSDKLRIEPNIERIKGAA
jgi:phage host-nuclease inhibitor protein Gam